MRPTVPGHADRNEWCTPPWLYALLHAEFGFTADAACRPENALAPAVGDDALHSPWSGIVFCNPPYAGSVLPTWVRKAWLESRRGVTVVLLVPVRTSVAWWHDYAMHGQIRFLRGRLKFGGGQTNAPFDSAVVVFYPPVLSLLRPDTPMATQANEMRTS